MLKKIVLMFAFVFGVAAMPVYAAEGDKTVTEDIISIGQGGKLYIEHTQIEGMIGSFDKIIRDRLNRPIVIFDSEGRRIEKVYEEDLNHDGDAELLVQMDLGGSAGYKEFALLQHDSGSYKLLWEDTGYPNAKVTFRKYMGKTVIYIRYLNTEFDPPKTKTKAFEFLEDGRVIPMTAEKAG